MKTRSELQLIINDLEASIPHWTEKGADEVDLAMAFADVADDAFENVAIEDYEWLRVKMFDIQAHYGIGGQ
ncbi:hypothetical protein DVT68_13315 [Dyella solisilvae]|uniref:Uncharacterized protein n=1 Tax=Dyella solisilvae TaxID=1920168 RepID=A0A370K6G7_9GAMM|nr:hypothetical protein [Dyella solisilvae]RDI98057.1 hypothetical protein DVT68_13315 [Dyella solisilvae]